MTMKREITPVEIENILRYIIPSKTIPEEIAFSICDNNKQLLREQLEGQMIYPEILEKLKVGIIKQYYSSIITPGDSVGIICAQSIGEMNTQMTLNSVDWKEILLYSKDGKCIIKPIGELIDTLLENNKNEIKYIKENRTEYLELPDGYKVPSSDKHGFVKWYKIEAITKHLPVGKLVKIKTSSGREVSATQSKSFMVWNGDEFIATEGSNIKVGDIVPTTSFLKRPDICKTHFDMKTIFKPSEYLYTSEVNKAIECNKKYKYVNNKRYDVFTKLNGNEFTVPYKRYDTMLGKRKEYLSNCPDGFIYIHTSNKFVSHIPDKIPLTNDFGFFVGLYLAEGLATNTFIGISNKDECITKRITDYCDKYGITYHTTITESKVVKGTSIDLKIHSVLLARMFKIICNTGSSNKKVPEFCYNAPDDFIKGMIDGYFSGDGTISKKDGSVVVSSVSEKLILGISSILSYYKIFGKISNYLLKKNNVGSKNIKRLYTLRISNGFAVNFARNFVLTESKKNERLQTITMKKNYKYERGRNQEKFPKERDVIFDEVVSVEYVEGSTEHVYDLTVEETRNFQLFNGLNLNDTFHKAGQCEKGMTQGVPRFQELLNATKNPKNTNCILYLKEKKKDISDVKDIVSNKILGFKLEQLTKDVKIFLEPKSEPWYEVYKMIYGNDFENYSQGIKFILNIDILYEYKIDIKYISDKINEMFEDIICVFSPINIGVLDLYVDTDNITLPEDRISYIDSENMIEIYLEECVLPLLNDMNVCGIEGIEAIYYSKDEKTNEWIIETDGANFKQLLLTDILDSNKVVSNDVWEIYNTLGIEAVREFLCNEFSNIMEGINLCHIKLLVERMTYAGTISSITRYTMRKDETGPISRASFEETMDNFLRAAAAGDIENTNGVSASIVCGKRTEIGSGMMDLYVDINKVLQMNNEEEQDNHDLDEKFEKFTINDIVDENIFEHNPEI